MMERGPPVLEPTKAIDPLPDKNDRNEEVAHNPDPSLKASFSRGDPKSAGAHEGQANPEKDEADGVVHQAAIAKWTRGLTILTGALAFAAVGSFIVSAYQLSAANNQLAAMQGQLEEMKSSSKQIERSIEQATRLADATYKSAETSAKMYNIQQRGWLNMQVTIAGQVQPNLDATFNVSSMDVGQNPVFKVSSLQEYHFVDGDTYDLTPFKNAPLPESSVSIFPGSGVSFSVVIPASEVTTDRIERFKAGSGALIILAKVGYVDAAGTAHTTGVCFRYDAKHGTLPFCGSGNWAE